jgi:hypothetical protein
MEGENKALAGIPMSSPRLKVLKAWLKIELGVEQSVVNDPPVRPRVFPRNPQFLGAFLDLLSEHRQSSPILTLQRGTDLHGRKI